MPTRIYFESFDSYSIPGSASFGAQGGGAVTVNTDAAQNYAGSAGAIKGTYPQQTNGGGGVFIWGKVNVWGFTQRKNHVYVRFRAKMPGAVKHGSKFIKIFGYNPRDNDTTGYNGSIPDNYANITFGLDYTGADNGGLVSVGFGDGSTPTNDTQNVINLDGSNPSWVGRSYGKPGFSISTPNGPWRSSNWGTDWHLFEFYVKFNSGTSAATEVNDGEVIVKIDGVTYIDVKGLYNRHWSNNPIEGVALFNQTQGTTSGPFELWYDNLEITQDAWGDQS